MQIARTVRQAYTYDEVTDLVTTKRGVLLSPTVLCTRQGIYQRDEHDLYQAIAYGTQTRCRDQAGHNREYENGKWLYC